MQELKSVQDWQQLATDLYHDVKTLSDYLRIEIDGYIGFPSWSNAINVREGILRLSFFFSPNFDFKCSASLFDNEGGERILGQTIIEGANNDG